ncbi:MAG TPA: magnesium chelatase domain-containing protein, partial [Saprospiraceae bacterium]|nr:magnesium chelatase domain-containing protein [Saprospiraceae bacterium]
PMGYNDVFLNIAGGIKVDDPSIDLALAVAIISSLENKPVPQGFCFAGEVGLSGEVRPVQKLDQKINEAERMGLTTIFISKYAKYTASNQLRINIIQVIKIEELLDIFN